MCIYIYIYIYIYIHTYIHIYIYIYICVFPQLRAQERCEHRRCESTRGQHVASTPTRPRAASRLAVAHLNIKYTNNTICCPATHTINQHMLHS